MNDLRQAAQALLDRWDSPLWKNGSTANAIADLRTALEQQQAEPSQWRDMVVVTLVRDGVNKHKARELADHFAASPQQQAEPVSELQKRYLESEKVFQQQAERWCMKANGCKTECGNCPNFTQPEQQAEPVHGDIRALKYRIHELEGEVMGYKRMLDVAEAASQPQQQAEPVAWEHHAKKLTHWLHCMSYNDSYFGEPAGLVKQVTAELNRLIGTALRSALEQKAEPVAWMVVNDAGEDELWWHNGSGNGKPLYTTPPQRKPLTEEEIRNAINTFKAAENLMGVNHIHVARAIEAAHGIKEGT